MACNRGGNLVHELKCTECGEAHEGPRRTRLASGILLVCPEFTPSFDPLDYMSQEEWNKKWTALKSGQSMVGLDGKTYKKK